MGEDEPPASPLQVFKLTAPRDAVTFGQLDLSLECALRFRNKGALIPPPNIGSLKDRIVDRQRSRFPRSSIAVQSFLPADAWLP